MSGSHSNKIRAAALKQSVCARFVAAQEATGKSKVEFCRIVGITPQQLANVAIYHGYPPPLAIVRACEEFGFTCDYFYRGLKGGIASKDLLDRLRDVERRLFHR